MALSKKDALDACRAILAGPRAVEMPRLDRIAAALQPPAHYGQEWVTTIQIPDDAPSMMKELARKSQTNYLPLLVKTFGQVIKVDGYYSESDEGATDPWFWWQANKMDSRQTGLFRDALKYGVSYSTVLPGVYGRGERGPAIKNYSPRRMTAVYQDPEADEWPMLALAVNGSEMTLFDEVQTYRFGIEPGPWPTGLFPAASIPLEAGRLTFIEAKAHDTGVCPVVRFRDRNLLSGEEQYGIVEPLLTIQERIDETTFQMQVAQYFQAFKQRYVIGWVPSSEQEELKAGAARFWYLDADPKDVKIDQLDAGAITPYIESRNSAIRDLAANGQIPAQALGIDGISNISDATLAGLEAAKNREGGEIKTSLGEAGEQMLRLCAFIDGNMAAAHDYTSELRWADFEARSFAAVIDGLVKEVQGLGLDPEIALEDVPGMTEQKLARAKVALRRKRALERVNGRAPEVPPVVTDANLDATA